MSWHTALTFVFVSNDAKIAWLFVVSEQTFGPSLSLAPGGIVVMTPPDTTSVASTCRPATRESFHSRGMQSSMDRTGLWQFNADGHGGFRWLPLGRRPRCLEWADQARGTARASIAFPQRLRRLLSPAAKGRHSSRDKQAG
jgi:hypothetical protein